MHDREKREVLRTNLQTMLLALDSISLEAHDPPNNIPPSAVFAPDVPPPPARGGRPRKDIDPAFVHASLRHRSKRAIARNLGCSARTIRRRLVEHGLSLPAPPVFHYHPGQRPVRSAHTAGVSDAFARISNFDLDRLVACILTTFPSFGRRLVQGSLRSQGWRIQKHRVVASIRRVTCRTRLFRRRVAERRLYKVAGPNSLWHHDGQHGLFAIRTFRALRL